VPLLIYTIGTSTRTIREFISLCQRFKLQAIIDIRRYPFSRLKHFKKAEFSSELKRNGIDYFYLGDLLGGFRDMGYEEHMKSAEFEKGIERLKQIASGQTTAFVCAEKLPWKCHRRFIASRLKQDRWRVIHILDQEQTWEPQDKEADLKLDI
jgi:uncharacterized protein (DUF488 family)